MAALLIAGRSAENTTDNEQMAKGFQASYLILQKVLLSGLTVKREIGLQALTTKGLEKPSAR